MSKEDISCLKCIFHIFFLFLLGDESLDIALAGAWRALSAFHKIYYFGVSKTATPSREAEIQWQRGTVSSQELFGGSVESRAVLWPFPPFSGSPEQVPAFGDVVPRAMLNVGLGRGRFTAALSDLEGFFQAK